MSNLIARPLWRSFPPSELEKAAQYARSGGIAVVKTRSWQLWGVRSTLLVEWAAWAVERAGIISDKGPSKGLMVARIVADWRSRVDEWITRDVAFKGATRLESYDCTQCAACCFNNRVVLDSEDQARWQNQKRLFRHTKMTGRQLLLVLQPTTKACPHLEGTRCGIYLVRPNMCREFPAGSEHCITSREERFNGNGLGRNASKKGSS
jgi:hypothetical protein